MPIETLDDWNAYMGCHGCCPMPVCATPSLVCESRSAELNQDEDSEGQAYEEEHATWISDGDAWIIANSSPGDIKTRADYIAAGHPEPMVPANTLYGCWAQFDRPVGDDVDPIPEIYRKVVSLPISAETILHDGIVGKKTAGNNWNTASAFNPPYVQASWSYMRVKTYTNEFAPSSYHPVTGNQIFSTSNGFEATYSRVATLSCDADTTGTHLRNVNIDSGSAFLPDLPWVSDADGEPWVELIPKSYTITAGTNITYVSGTWELVFGTAQTADSCPGPWGQAQGGAFLSWVWVDVTAKGADKAYEISDPITRDELEAKTATEVTLAEWVGSSCIAKYNTNWPTIGFFDWTVANSVLWANAFYVGNQRRALAYIRLIEARPRFKISYGHPGSYFKITYDILDEPIGWDDTIDDPGYVPPDPLPVPAPPIPQIPRPGRPLRTFLSEDNVVEWTGPGTPVPALLDPTPDEGDPPTPEEIAANAVAIAAAEATWLTPKFTIETPTVPGERRVVNIRYSCYHGAKYGMKPQVMGEAVELPDPV